MKIFNIFKKKDNIITTTNKIDDDYNNCVYLIYQYSLFVSFIITLNSILE